VDARATAESTHGISQLGIDERVHDHGCMSAGAADRALEVVDGFGARMPHLLELLLGELRFQRLHEARSGLTG
jgi:hypothetical protein